MSKIAVKSKRPGFRRAGISFSDTEATVLDTDKLTKEQIESIKSDPGLIVVEGGAAGKGSSTDAMAELNAERKALADERSGFELEKTAFAKAQKAFETERKTLADELKSLEANKATFAKEREAFEKQASKETKK